MIEVSVVTPTYNRRRFIPMLISYYESQLYPKENMEWIILDDGHDKVEDLFKEATQRIPNIRYYALDEKQTIGSKRNQLNEYAQGNIIVCMDDDDYYPPTRVSSVVEAFQRHPRASVAGTSEMRYYYLDTKKVYAFGPIHPNHATNNTMAWRKSYTASHHYDPYVTHAEEVSFLNNYREMMIQLDPLKTIVAICHEDNTVDKNTIRSNGQSHSHPKLLRELPMRLSDLIKNKKAVTFYESISHK